ncbi:class I SAM-dependent methyltransferase [Luteipulveratus sp. YIM 133132]|uniref:class I SAM-dependent methyltransferase n=1 Tax=Luteipulveratus flavus TaxID=3031728 RepID=UPI0023B05DB2|nr:class I SAM-dependent methyltransferase [Luteipulveratus sp. YIM 133132]MDE9365982.1 class I SAM-dependent methyltransferase [Luteipulveratus sp. YIM 133132]
MCEVCGDRLRERPLRGGAVLQECAVCGHLTRDLTAAPAAHREHAYGGEPTLDRARLALTYATLRRGLPRPPESVFEVGYGTGALLRRFHDAGANIAGADPDQLELEVDPVVRAHARLWPAPVEQVRAADVTADLVYGIHVLEHVLDPARTLRVARDLLRPGGVAQFLTPAGDSTGPRWYGQAWWMLEDPTHIRFFTADSLARLARVAGFVDVEVRRPVLDSVVTDAASVARVAARSPRPAGVLASKPVLALGLATAPAVLGARLAYPPMRPTLQLVARRPRGDA